MMTIEAGEKSFELQTNLLTVQRMEQTLGVSAMNVFDNLESATVEEFLKILKSGFAPKDPQREELEFAVLEHWGMADIFLASQELIAKVMFTGTDAQKEKKMEKLRIPEDRKNALRELLCIEIAAVPCSTGTI
jgi:hypothetical protein